MRSVASWLAITAVCGGVIALFHSRWRELVRRFRLALWVALIGYAVIFAVRLIQNPPSQAQLITLAGVVTILGSIWLALRLILGLRR